MRLCHPDATPPPLMEAYMLQKILYYIDSPIAHLVSWVDVYSIV
jgi:hypothetical protein